MSADETKVCPFCAESIKARAKVCPECRQVLTLRTVRHPAITLLLILVMFAGMLFLFAAIFAKFASRLHPPPYYSEYSGSLQVIDSRMNWMFTTNEYPLCIVGIITNRSPIPWKDPRFDCRFFDAKGNLIDASQGMVGVYVLPNDAAAFRLRFTPARPTNDYASFKVSVTWAVNSISPW